MVKHISKLNYRSSPSTNMRQNILKGINFLRGILNQKNPPSKCNEMSLLVSRDMRGSLHDNIYGGNEMARWCKSVKA